MKDKIPFRRRVLLLLNRARFNFPIKVMNRFPRIVLHERYKKPIKWSKWIFSLIGLVSSFFVFQTLFISFLFALGLFVLTYLLEKSLFTYRTLYVSPMPDFQLENNKWSGCVFGYLTPGTKELFIPIVGWILDNSEYAEKIHSLLLSWTYGEVDDREANICQSVIIEGDQYHFFCYPNPDRRLAKSFYQQVEDETDKNKKTRDNLHEKLVFMLIISKTFMITPSSFLPTFRNCYIGGQYLFRLMIKDHAGQPQQIAGLQDLVLYNLKIKNRSELIRTDIELDHLRML